MSEKKEVLLAKLEYLWEKHDRLEREIIRLERHFTDDELERLLES